VGELRRDGISDQIVLNRFTPEEVTELLTAVLPSHTPDFTNRLFRETEGLPFFIVEYLSALSQHQLPPTPEGSWDIPRTVRDLLVTRLALVDETESQLLQTAATIGHAFDFNLLRQISGRSDDETVIALEMLVARGLLVEQSAGYDFSHTKLRELAYAEMGLARRRLLHRRVADALSQPNRRQVQTMAVTADIANHYQKAGLDEESAAYFAQAGDQARALYAHQEAIYYFKSALALGFIDAWKLHEASGDLYIRLGDYASALASYETAASIVDKAELGRLEHKLAQVYLRQGAWRRAEAQLSQAEKQISQPADIARLYIDWSHVAFNLNELTQAKAYVEQGQKLAGSPQIDAQCHNISGILARHEGAVDEAMQHFAQSVALARTHDLPDTQIAALNNLALAETAAGQYSAAQEHLKDALYLCAKFGDRHREAALHNNLADLLHQIGDENASMAELKMAVAIYAEIGGQPGNWQPEIWKLTVW
jgi:predicted ATPase